MSPQLISETVWQEGLCAKLLQMQNLNLKIPLGLLSYGPSLIVFYVQYNAMHALAYGFPYLPQAQSSAFPAFHYWQISCIP